MPHVLCFYFVVSKQCQFLWAHVVEKVVNGLALHQEIVCLSFVHTVQKHADYLYR